MAWSYADRQAGWLAGCWTRKQQSSRSTDGAREEEEEKWPTHLASRKEKGGKNTGGTEISFLAIDVAGCEGWEYVVAAEGRKKGKHDEQAARRRDNQRDG